MRQVVLDTETTGLETAQGHRIIEIGCVEMVDRRLTHRHFHQYIHPERDIEEGALEVHGITEAFLADKPRFADIAGDFLEFVSNAELVIHNAAFDIAFLNYELALLGASVAVSRMDECCSVLDTLAMARDLHPGQRNSLDALCKRYSVDNSQRSLHGALLDAEILADVYLAMTGGQATLDLSVDRIARRTQVASWREGARPPLRIVRANADELAAHAERLDALDSASDGRCLWKQLDAARAGSVH